MAIHQILTQHAASISDLKKNPLKIVLEGTAQEGAIAILNRNKPVFYCINPRLFEIFQEILENQELGKLATQRLATLDPIEVRLDDL